MSRSTRKTSHRPGARACRSRQTPGRWLSRSPASSRPRNGPPIARPRSQSSPARTRTLRRTPPSPVGVPPLEQPFLSPTSVCSRYEVLAETRKETENIQHERTLPDPDPHLRPRGRARLPDRTAWRLRRPILVGQRRLYPQLYRSTRPARRAARRRRPRALGRIPARRRCDTGRARSGAEAHLVPRLFRAASPNISSGVLSGLCDLSSGASAGAGGSFRIIGASVSSPNINHPGSTPQTTAVASTRDAGGSFAPAVIHWLSSGGLTPISAASSRPLTLRPWRRSYSCHAARRRSENAEAMCLFRFVERSTISLLTIQSA